MIFNVERFLFIVTILAFSFVTKTLKELFNSNKYLSVWILSLLIFISVDTFIQKRQQATRLPALPI